MIVRSRVGTEYKIAVVRLGSREDGRQAGGREEGEGQGARFVPGAARSKCPERQEAGLPNLAG